MYNKPRSGDKKPVGHFYPDGRPKVWPDRNRKEPDTGGE